MAEPPLTHSPDLGTDNLEPNANYNPDPAPKEEPQEQLAIPPFMAQLPGPAGNLMDTDMTDVAVRQALHQIWLALTVAQPSPAAHPPSATPTSVTHRTATPTRTINGHVEPTPMPLKAAPHGAPARRYLNEKVTGVLLEGMKRLVIEQSVADGHFRHDMSLTIFLT
jgi:hypothetical protein